MGGTSFLCQTQRLQLVECAWIEVCAPCLIGPEHIEWADVGLITLDHQSCNNCGPDFQITKHIINECRLRSFRDGMVLSIVLVKQAGLKCLSELPLGL